MIYIPWHRDEIKVDYFTLMLYQDFINKSLINKFEIQWMSNKKA